MKHNFVSKHIQRTGSGAHIDKHSKKAPRSKQKQKWKRQFKQETNQPEK